MDCIYHHGILGQRWGIRRFQNEDGTLTEEGRRRYGQYKADRKDVKTATRHLAASKRNLVSRAKAQDDDAYAYRQAYADLTKVNGKLYAPWSQAKKRTDVQSATDEVTRRGEQWERTKSEYMRAKRLYDNDLTELKNKTASMVSKYGKESVKELRYKKSEIGETFVMDLVKTGVTVADLPLFGTKYTADYISRKDYVDRVKLLNERAGKK